VVLDNLEERLYSSFFYNSNSHQSKSYFNKKSFFVIIQQFNSRIIPKSLGVAKVTQPVASLKWPKPSLGQNEGSQCLLLFGYWRWPNHPQGLGGCSAIHRSALGVASATPFWPSGVAEPPPRLLGVVRPPPDRL
jgi:hypothetical protein